MGCCCHREQGKFPFEAEDDDEETLCELIANGLQDDLKAMAEFEDVSSLAVDVLQGLLTVRPEERLPAAEAVEHPWVTGSDTMAGVQASTAKSLHHVHTRLQKLVTTTGLQREGRHFEAGSWIIEREETDEMRANANANATHDDGDGVVYLISTGECELLVRRPDGGFVRVGKRRQGNFVGEGQVLLSGHQLRSLGGPSPPSSPGSSAGPPVFASAPVPGGGGGSGGGRTLTVDIDSAMGSILPASIVEGGGANVGMGSNRQVQALSLTPMGAMDGHIERSDGGTENLSPQGSPTSPEVGALIAAGASNHVQNKHVVWVRAVTDVEAVELVKEDMQWALEDDYRLGSELREAMYMRRRELRKQKKLSAKATQQAEPTSPQQSQWSPMWSPTAAPRRAALFDAMPDFVLDGDGETDGAGGGGDPAFELSPVAADDADDSSNIEYALRLSSYKAGIVEMMQEFFHSQEVGEVAARLAELQAVCGSAPVTAEQADTSSSLGEVFVKKAVVTALDFAAREFELTAVLISALAPGMLKAEEIGGAFRTLLTDMDDVIRTAPFLCSIPAEKLLTRL